MARRKLDKAPAVDTRFQPGHHPTKTPKPIKRFTIIEARTQKSAVEELLIRGASTTQIVRAMRKLVDADGVAIGCGPERTKRLIESVKTTWEHEDQDVRALKKAAAERRLINHIENAKGPLDKGGKYYDANFAAIASYEKLLADLQGTREPVKIHLDFQVSVAVGHLIATFTPEQVQRALTEMNQMQRDAENWRAGALPAKTG